MSQQVQGLINKIKTEGIEAANNQAKEIEANAHKKAEEIIADANAQAERIAEDARREAELLKEKTENALKQTARDMILSLKKEIQSMLKNIIADDIKETLSFDRLADIIGMVIKDFFEKRPGKEGIVVALSEQDLKKLKKGFVAKLQQEIKKGVEFKATDDIDKGFTISFDGGKSCFDFSDVSLAEYLSGYLSSEIAALLIEKK